MYSGYKSEVWYTNRGTSFLLVSLNMDAILGEITFTRRRKRLDGINHGGGWKMPTQQIYHEWAHSKEKDQNSVWKF